MKKVIAVILAIFVFFAIIAVAVTLQNNENKAQIEEKTALEVAGFESVLVIPGNGSDKIEYFRDKNTDVLYMKWTGGINHDTTMTVVMDVDGRPMTYTKWIKDRDKIE
jgi:hypothetical protein